MWLLLEVPTSWPSDPLDHEHLPPEVVAHLASFRSGARGRRVVFLRRSFSPLTDCSPHLFVCRPTETRPDVRRWRLGGYHDLLAVDLDRAAAGAGGEPWPEPLLLVCTHGRHDRCCARWGHRFYRRLAAHAGDPVWQCSHIGGDRFAANLLWLPWGVFYGRLEPADAERLLAAVERREILLDRYRGRACHPFPAQAAEYFVRRAWDELAADGVALLAHRRMAEDRFHARLESRRGRRAAVTVGRRASPFELATTCSATGERPVPLYDLLALEEPG